MFPGVITEYEDQSDVSSLPITEVRNRPLYGSIFTSDKGPEEWTRVSGKEFFDLYGKQISYNRHGQPLLQAAASINAGAELFCKRLVASDATLANIGVVASFETKVENVVDADGKQIYVDEKGNQYTESSGDHTTPLTVTKGVVTYSTKYAADSHTIEEATESIKKTLTSEKDFLLFIISDNGRGKSKKRIRIVPNYRVSRTLDYVYYTLSVVEDTVEDESMSFSVNPDLIVNGENISLYSMVSTHSTQVKCYVDDDSFDAYMQKLCEFLGGEDAGWTRSAMLKNDPLFCCTNKGEALENLSVSEDGVNLTYSYGQALSGGTNGALGDYPFKNDDPEDDDEHGPIRKEYIKQAVATLDGTFDTVIFNVDQNMMDAFFDANYPAEVKHAIESLATFREDFVFIRDQGLGRTDLGLITEATLAETKSMFCASYCQSYDIIDPYTKKQVPVTITYSLAKLFVEHLNNGRILPPAGMKHSMIITDAIYGTLSFAPTICPEPEGNQKEKLEELRVNYASYLDNQLVLESLYTSQERMSQWSWLNNVMGIQEVVRAIRRRCPAIRYSFIDGEDLERYRADVEEIIAAYRTNFKLLELEFVSDSTYSANKIFYAVLKVVYNDFIQTEMFKIVALSTVDSVVA